MLASLAACGGATVKDCEEQLLSKLKSPSSYKRINVKSHLFNTHKPPFAQVEIEYDAANSYGTPLRDTEVCYYKIDNGKVTLTPADPYAELAPENLIATAEKADDALDAATSGEDGNFMAAEAPTEVAEDTRDPDFVESEEVPDEAVEPISENVPAVVQEPSTNADIEVE